MLVRRFLIWCETASARERERGAAALARAYLSGDLSPAEGHDALVALTALLDDPSPLVRQAMAEAFSDAADAPHHLVAALAADQSDIAVLVLARSPVLADAELIDCAALGDVFAQSAIAIRTRVSAPVAAALAEVGGREALIALVVNPGADLPEFSMRRIVERFGDDGELREALLSRPALPVAVRLELVHATTQSLSGFATACAWLTDERAERLAADAHEAAVIVLSAQIAADETRALVRHLRIGRRLTAGLMLRAIVSGNVTLFEAALAELTGVAARRVAGLMREESGSGFAAVYDKAGLPSSLFATFRAALRAARACPGEGRGDTAGRLSLRIIEHMLSDQTADAGSHRVVARLRRFEVEAARDEARRRANDMLAQAPIAIEADIATIAIAHYAADEQRGRPPVEAALPPLLEAA